jgi:hypothetical protein
MSLFKRPEWDRVDFWNALMQDNLLNTPVDPSFAKMNPTCDGVCMGNKKTCKCGAPLFLS